jgi:hypothetical protein
MMVFIPIGLSGKTPVAGWGLSPTPPRPRDCSDIVVRSLSGQ